VLQNTSVTAHALLTNGTVAVAAVVVSVAVVVATVVAGIVATVVNVDVAVGDVLVYIVSGSHLLLLVPDSPAGDTAGDIAGEKCTVSCTCTLPWCKQWKQQWMNNTKCFRLAHLLKSVIIRLQARADTPEGKHSGKKHPFLYNCMRRSAALSIDVTVASLLASRSINTCLLSRHLFPLSP
jgi:hypothetical protein